MNRDLAYGITAEEYWSDIDPFLTRPLSLGRMRKRPRPSGDPIEAAQLHEIQVVPSSRSAAMRERRAKVKAPRSFE